MKDRPRVYSAINLGTPTCDEAVYEAEIKLKGAMRSVVRRRGAPRGIRAPGMEGVLAERWREGAHGP